MARPCGDCGHDISRHDGGPEGMCLDCRCPGWIGPRTELASELRRDNGSAALAWGLAGLIFAAGLLCGWLLLPRAW
jgi:hypothetical protein